MAQRFGRRFRDGPALLVRRSVGPRAVFEFGRHGSENHQFHTDPTPVLDSHTLWYYGFCVENNS